MMNCCCFKRLFIGYRLFVCVLLCCMVGLLHAVEEDTNNNAQKKKKSDLCFPVVGDIGGIPEHPFQTFSQKQVAKLLANVVEEHNCKFIVGVGDNFYYNGVKNVEDPRFNLTFERTYSAPSLSIPWYMIAGNHDHGLNVSAQIAYTKVSNRWNFPDFYYTKAFKIPDSNKTLQLVMLETTMLCFYNKKSNAPTPERQWAWIENTLKNSKSDYLIVAGHHPIYSGGNHGNTKCLIERLKPLLEKYSVTAYFSGHDHNLQHIKPSDSSVHYFVSGSGNFVDRRFQHKPFLPPQSARFEYATDSGFDLVRVTADEIKLQTFTVEPGKEDKSIYDVTIKPRILLTSAAPTLKPTSQLDDEMNYMKINHEVNKIVDKAMSDIHKRSQDLLTSNKNEAKLQSDKPNNNKPEHLNTINQNNNNRKTQSANKLVNNNINPTKKEIHLKTDTSNQDVTNNAEPDNKPVKLIDGTKITIDNLSDIPLSSYSNLDTIKTDSKQASDNFNKTGNKLTDFILQRLPSDRLKDKKEKQYISRQSNTSHNTSSDKNRTFNNTNTELAVIPQSVFYRPPQYSGFVNYAPTPNTYYGYTPSLYNPQTAPLVNYNSVNNFYNSYWQSGVNSNAYLMTPLQQPFTPVAGKDVVDRKTKREASAPPDNRMEKVLSTFFELQEIHHEDIGTVGN